MRFRRIAACILLTLVSIICCVPAYSRARTDPQVRAAQKQTKKEQKRMNKQLKAEQKSAKRASERLSKQNTGGLHSKPRTMQ
jgi:uncharacterized ion transporter superfamily protein YfcC